MYKIIALILISSVALFGCQEKKVEQNTETENVAQDNKAIKAPQFKLNKVNGGEVNLSDYKGKIVILDFWATWCGPCRMGIPDLVALQNEYKDDLAIIGISTDNFSGTDKQVVPFMKEFKINYPIVYADEDVINNYGGIQAIPTSFVIDKDGNVVARHIGLVSKAVYENKIKELLKKS